MSLYVPVVKAKANDIQAIALMGERPLTLIKPLFELPVSIENKQASTDASKAVDTILKSLPDVPFYFDPLSFEAEFRQISAVESLALQGKKFSPTFGMHRFPEDTSTLRRLIHTHRLSLGIRIESQDIIQSPEEVWSDILEYSGRLDLSPGQVELLLDLQYIKADQKVLIKESILDFIMLEPRKFRPGALTLIGSSALASVACVDVDGYASVERIEREIWADVSFELGGTRSIGFGDYGVVNPSFVFSGPNPNSNAKIRYTQGSAHHVFRGHGLYNPPRFDQYHELAERVVNSGRFLGASFSFGDKYIAACATQECGPGNLGTWVKVDMNHHLEVVAQQTQKFARELVGVSSASDLKSLLIEI